MLTRDEIKNNKEISKLIEYGYDLHKQDMNWYGYRSIPNFEFYSDESLPMKKLSGGGIFGTRGYPNHSEQRVFTILGITVGKQTEDGFDFEYSTMMQTDNDYRNIYFSRLKISDEQKRSYKSLEYDYDNDWDDMEDSAKTELFIKTMEFIGFKKEDIISVLNGTLTAKEAYINAAPEEIKNLDWISIHRRMFTFDGNVAIEGRFDSMDMDTFPFPFDGQPILNCSKVKTACIHFETNKRKVKLINVNCNPESIIYTDLKNAIIEEPIDLSLVDARGTKFGHHTVINLENSIADLDDIDLHLAVNENGDRYEVDKDGKVKFDNNSKPKVVFPSKEIEKEILILANSDNEKMSKEAMENDADGIGLVRTEHIFTDINDIKKMVQLLNHPDEEIERENLNRIKELQIKQIKNILKENPNKPIVFRLFDFKLKEYLKNYGIKFNSYHDEEYIKNLRGAFILYDNKKILTTQVEAIFEIYDGTDKDVNLLIPMLRSSYEFTYIKDKIIKLSKKYNLKSLQIGAMIENVEMSNDTDELAKEADFISIGTNDLTESVTGLSRDTNSIEFQELSAEVKAVIEETIYRARSTNPNIVIGICGEHSNYVENLPYYSSLDINYITCSPSFVMPNKEFLGKNCNLETGRARQLKFNSKK